jgi:hypothetical protein
VDGDGFHRFLAMLKDVGYWSGFVSAHQTDVRK